MTFKTNDKARWVLVKTGVGAAPLMIALHMVPHADHDEALLPGSEHVPHESHQPFSARTLASLEMSSTSSMSSVDLSKIFQFPNVRKA